MTRRIEISAGDVAAGAELNDTATATLVWDILPISSHASLWGEEVFFEVPLETGPEDPKEVVQKGDVGYWPPGRALCLFFGKTPVSRGREIRPYSPVNVIGRITGDAAVLRRVREGDSIAVSRAQE